MRELPSNHSFEHDARSEPNSREHAGGVRTPSLVTSVTRRCAGLAILLCAGLFASSCSFTDVFRTGGDDADTPAATATAESDAGVSRLGPKNNHRYFDTPPTSYDPSAFEPVVTPEDQYLDDLAEQWAETDTVHFELDIDGKTYLDADENIELKSADGDLKRPDRARAEAKVGVSFASFDVDLVVIGDDAYMTNFLNGNWERAPANFDFNPALIFDDEAGIGGVLAEMDDPRIGGETTIDGRTAEQLSGTVSQSDVARLVAGALEGDEITVQLWMDSETNELLRISLTEPDDVDGDPTTWTITFSDHGKAVTIEAPDV